MFEFKKNFLFKSQSFCNSSGNSHGSYKFVSEPMMPNQSGESRLNNFEQELDKIWQDSQQHIAALSANTSEML